MLLYGRKVCKKYKCFTWQGSQYLFDETAWVFAIVSQVRLIGMTKLHTVVCVVVETLQQKNNGKGYNFMCHRWRYTYPSKLLPNTSPVYIKLIFTALHVGSKEYEFLNSNINWANMNHLVFIVMAFIVLWLIVNCFKLQCIAYNIAMKEAFYIRFVWHCYMLHILKFLLV